MHRHLWHIFSTISVQKGIGTIGQGLPTDTSKRINNIVRRFLRDDVLIGATTQDELIMKRDECIDILAKYGLELSKWVSNSR